uniref:Uncharacterized protein n=1 Tax=Ditylenchus dipsaci TaxID=166011 RepID=A0A915E939_9BILA
MTDIDLIAKVAQSLMQLRLTRPLLVLLKYARRFSEELRAMPNVATYYSRCFEATFDRLDHRSEEHASETLSLVYFLIGCPVEGGSNFARARSMLVAANATCASGLVEIAANSAVSRIPANIPAKRPSASGGGAPFDKKIRPS